MNDTPSEPLASPCENGNRTKRKALRLQIRGLERNLAEKTQGRFPGSPLGVDVQATDLALRSTRLVLDTMRMREIAKRAAARKGRDASKLMSNGS